MAAVRVSGTEGYAEEAEALFKQYESLPFADVQRHVWHLIPTAPGWILDVGSGTGRDAAGFAAMGHRVVAVEPTAEMRLRAAALHPSALIEWVDDGLPELDAVVRRGERFEMVMLTAVWMHLDADQRRRSMPPVASLTRAGGVVALSLRHGPVPPGRRTFEVGAEETIALAGAEGLSLVLQRESRDSLLGRPGVSWTRVAFRKAGAEI